MLSPTPYAVPSPTEHSNGGWSCHRRTRKRRCHRGPTGAAYLLAQQTTQWKLVHSLWILVVAFGCGCMSPLGWVWAGYESRSRTVWISSVFWGFMAWVVAGLAINAVAIDQPEGSFDLGVAYPVTLVLVWFGGTIHALLLARHVLRAKLVHDEAAAAPRLG